MIAEQWPEVSQPLRGSGGCVMADPPRRGGRTRVQATRHNVSESGFKSRAATQKTGAKAYHANGGRDPSGASWKRWKKVGKSRASWEAHHDQLPASEDDDKRHPMQQAAESLGMEPEAMGARLSSGKGLNLGAGAGQKRVREAAVSHVELLEGAAQCRPRGRRPTPLLFAAQYFYVMITTQMTSLWSSTSITSWWWRWWWWWSVTRSWCSASTQQSTQ